MNKVKAYQREIHHTSLLDQSCAIKTVEKQKYAIFQNSL